MFLDERMTLCEDTPLNTGAVGNHSIGNEIDLGFDGLDLGNGLFWLLFMTKKAAGSGARASFKLYSSPDRSLPTSTRKIHIDTVFYSVSDMEVTGKPLFIMPLLLENYDRYLRIEHTTAGAAFTGGALSSFLTTDPAHWHPVGKALP